MAEDQELGIVAIGRNEGARLQRCLESVPAGVPIVYVDSGSTDGSVAHARSAKAEVVELDLAVPFTAARARNEGFARLLERWPKIQLVQFLDGDCEIEPEWLGSAIAFLASNAAVAAVCGRRRERYPDASFYNKLCDQEWDTAIGRAKACGGDSLMRVEALRQVGGFDPNLTAGEEPELCARYRDAGWEVWRIEAPMTIHDAAMFHFRQWWLRAVRSGYGYAQVWHKTTRSPSPPLYGRELARAFAWTAGVPLLAFLLNPAIGSAGFLLAGALWTVQFARLAKRSGPRMAVHLMVGKAAEALGAIKYAQAALSRRNESAITYK
ncbi:glycosyltransferase family 2 protein [Parafrankia sp. BMG5.11]|uniref:glycosyltransferase n=1 Tax=Parafrankia sp. BMG5.11 TaxID=222540 RepID=UPI001A9F2989|nr:glycosyltransferase [Parafrankia sp. BMG5.11]